MNSGSFYFATLSHLTIKIKIHKKCMTCMSCRWNGGKYFSTWVNDDCIRFHKKKNPNQTSSCAEYLHALWFICPVDLQSHSEPQSRFSFHVLVLIRTIQTVCTRRSRLHTSYERESKNPFGIRDLSNPSADSWQMFQSIYQTQRSSFWEYKQWWW